MMDSIESSIINNPKIFLVYVFEMRINAQDHYYLAARLFDRCFVLSVNKTRYIRVR